MTPRHDGGKTISDNCQTFGNQDDRPKSKIQLHKQIPTYCSSPLEPLPPKYNS